MERCDCCTELADSSADQYQIGALREIEPQTTDAKAHQPALIRKYICTVCLSQWSAVDGNWFPTAEVPYYLGPQLTANAESDWRHPGR